MSILSFYHAGKGKEKYQNFKYSAFYLFIFWVVQDASLIDLAIAGKCAPELGLILQAFRAEDANKE